MDNASRHLVFLVPDTFGSHLRDEQGRVWLDEHALVDKGARRLAADGPQLLPDGVIAALYGSLASAL